MESVSSARDPIMYPTCADLNGAGGGDPHPVGFAEEQEHRPSPPATRAASIEAMSLPGRSVSVLMMASTASWTTLGPERILPWTV